MGLIDRIKTAFSAARYRVASGFMLQGFGMLGSKPRPFSPHAALRMFHGWAYAAAMFNANAVANVPLRLYTRRRSGRKLYATRPAPKHVLRYMMGDGSTRPAATVMTKAAEFAGDLEEVMEPHPAMSILQGVNPNMNGYELTILMMLDQQICGDHYRHVVLDPTLEIPAELWRMDPRLTQIIPSPERWVKGYAYGYDGTTLKEFPADEVDHFKIPNPGDYLYGRGWFQGAWAALGLDAAKRETDTAKFDNLARPDWLLSIPGGSEKQFERLDAAIKAKHEGPKNAGKYMVAAGDVKATALQWDVPETGSATRVIEEIAAASGVPVAMLLSNDPTKASSQTAQLAWMRNTVQPYCRLYEEKLNERHIPRYPDAEEMFVCHDPVAFEDREALQKKIVAYVAGGIWTPNEGRQEEGYPPSDQEEADRLYPPTGSTAGAAAVAGDMSVGQNDRRRNEDA